MNEDYENYLYERLATIRRDYEAAAKPIINELVKIKAMQPVPPIFVDLLALPPEQREFIEGMIKRGLK
jgi:hypothetical protein